MKRAAVFAAAAVLLAAPFADAEERAPAAVCARGECVSLDDGVIARIGVYPYSGTGEIVSPPPLAAYYELRGLYANAFYVPSARAVRVGFNWFRVDERTAALLAAKAGALRPRAAPTLVRVSVAGRPASRAAPYAAIFTVLPPARPPDASRRVKIVLRSTEESPWTNAHTDVEYVPSAGVLHRHGEWVRASAALENAIERDLRRAALASADRRSRALGYGAAAFLIFGVAVALWLNQRGRRRMRARAD